MTMLGHGHELEGRGVTYANWWPTTRWHPKRYAVQEARAAVEVIRSKTRLERLLEGDTGGAGQGVPGGVALTNSCGYFHQGGGDGDGEAHRREMAGRRRPCWLFARKFTPRAGVRIARFSSIVMGF